jgi:FkbM family methyltransferase
MLRAVLKRLRVQPFLNRVSTTCLRALVGWLPRGTPDFIARHLPRVGLFRFRAPGGERIALLSEGDDWVATQIFWKGLERSEPDAVLFYEMARRARVTIDVGAHIGLYSLLAASANPGGRVLAFEPLPRVFSRLYRNVEANQRDNIECFPMAVGRTEGIEDFYFAPIEPLPSSSGLNPHFFHESGVLVRSQPVPVISLDTFCVSRGTGQVDLVKIDTESTEAAVLDGMTRVLGESRPHIFCEVLDVSDTADEVDGLLRRHGYRFFHLTPDGPKPNERLVGHRSFRNYLCIAREDGLSLLDDAVR